MPMLITPGSSYSLPPLLSKLCAERFFVTAQQTLSSGFGDRRRRRRRFPKRRQSVRETWVSVSAPGFRFNRLRKQPAFLTWHRLGSKRLGHFQKRGRGWFRFIVCPAVKQRPEARIEKGSADRNRNQRICKLPAAYYCRCPAVGFVLLGACKHKRVCAKKRHIPFQEPGEDRSTPVLASFQRLHKLPHVCLIL